MSDKAKKQATVDLTEDKGFTIMPFHLIYTRVCVPVSWSDERIVDWVDSANPAGTTNGWQICDEPIKTTEGQTVPVKEPCPDDPNRVHVFLNC